MKGRTHSSVELIVNKVLYVNPVNVSIVVPAPVVRKMDNAVHWINLYSVNDAIGFPNTYPLESNVWIALSNVLNNRVLAYIVETTYLWGMILTRNHGA